MTTNGKISHTLVEYIIWIKIFRKGHESFGYEEEIEDVQGKYTGSRLSSEATNELFIILMWEILSLSSSFVGQILSIRERIEA